MQTQAVDTKVKWNIDQAHSHIGFHVKHMMFTNVKGNFTEFDASIHTTGENTESSSATACSTVIFKSPQLLCMFSKYR